MVATFENPGLQVTPDHKLELIEAPVHTPGAGDVLLHIKACGICGSDIHFWKHGRIGELRFEGNCILGHEASGVVVKVGEGVTNVVEGDRVAIEPQVPCGQCYLCMDGNYNLCPDVQFSGVYPYEGAIQRYKVHKARFVHKMPDNMTFAQGALVEPLSVAYHGIQKALVGSPNVDHLGRGIMISGAGTIGLCTLLLAKASGASTLVISDISESRLEFAKSLVPEVKTYKVDKALNHKENAKEIRKLFGTTEYEAPTVVYECTGVASGILTGAFTVRRSGTLLVIGVGSDEIDHFPFMHLSLAEIDVKFINRYHDSWSAVINLIANKVISVDKLVTHRFPIERAVDAFNAIITPEANSVKVLIED